MVLTPQMNTADPFKGIALFTPGGDVIYCIDPNKQDRWHLHLCAALQEILGLPEPPHFLVPCYTATIDLWRDPTTLEIRTIAEASPLTLRYQELLNVIFGQSNLVWQALPRPEMCDPTVLITYRSQFPQLWETHDLVLRYEQATSYPRLISEKAEPATSDTPRSGDPQGYVLRLFVSGNNAATERTLLSLHQLLEQALGQPYTLKVIDVFQHPEQAEADQVSATPTLVKVWPRPVRRVIGNLENVDQLIRLLELTEPDLWQE